MKRSKFRWARLSALVMIVVSMSFAALKPQRAAESSAANQVRDERAAAIEAALFMRAEFFGAQAIVPYPTAEARTRLAEVAKAYPQAADVQLELAKLSEKLNDAESAEQAMLRYVELEKNSVQSLELLSSFYLRRARFAEAAAT